MKKIILWTIPLSAAAFIAGCGGTAENKPAAANINTAPANTIAAKPAAAAPTKEALMTIEKSAWEAWKNKDTKFWDGFMADKYIESGPNGKIDKAAAIKMMSEDKSEVKSYSLSDDQMKMLGNDAALLTYKAEQDYTENGKPGPKNVWAASIYVREGDKWKSAYHNEVAAVDPKAAPAKPAKPASNDKPAADAKAADPATEALLAVEKKGWEAWKARDQKAIEPIVANDLMTMEPTGRYDHDATMKLWFDAKCDIKSYTLSDPISGAITSDVSLLIFKASVDGDCGGQPIPATRSTSVYVKDGDSWKLAFALNAPA
jgi:hypothetical protein